MKIAVVTTFPNGDDDGLVRALADRGLDVDLHARPDLGLPDAPDLGHRLADAWVGDAPDVVLAHGWLAGLASQVATRLTGAPVVQRLASPARGEDPDRARLEPAVARSAALMLVASAGQGERLLAQGVRRDRIRLVPQGLDVDHFTDHGPAEDSHGARHRLVIADDLDHPAYVGAVVDILPTLPDARLTVVGTADPTAPHRQETARYLVAMAEQRRVTDRLELRGPLDEKALPPLLRSADVVVLPGDDDAQAGFALRAMGCGTPVVAKGVGALADVVADEVTGVLVGSRSEPLADAVRGLLTDETRRESFGLAATDRARVRFSWPVVAAATERVLAEAVAGPADEPSEPAEVAS